jgi:hypothetical protein
VPDHGGDARQKRYIRMEPGHPLERERELERPNDKRGDGALGDIQEKHGQGCLPPESAINVGGPDVAAPNGCDVHSLHSTDENAEWDGAQKVRDRAHKGDKAEKLDHALNRSMPS